MTSKEKVLKRHPSAELLIATLSNGKKYYNIRVDGKIIGQASNRESWAWADAEANITRKYLQDIIACNTPKNL